MDRTLEEEGVWGNQKSENTHDMVFDSVISIWFVLLRNRRSKDLIFEPKFGKTQDTFLLLRITDWSSFA